MAGFHTITIFLAVTSGLYAQLTPYVWQTHRDEQAPTIPLPPGYHTIVAASQPGQMLFGLWACAGNAYQQLCYGGDEKASTFVGWISIWNLLKVFGYAFEIGMYMEVLAYSEDMPNMARQSDLYVRIPYISNQIYAVMHSPWTILDVWRNNYGGFTERFFFSMWQLADEVDHTFPIVFSKPLDYEQQIMGLFQNTPTALLAASLELFDTMTLRYRAVYTEGWRSDTEDAYTIGDRICAIMKGTLNDAEVLLWSQAAQPQA